MTGTLDQRHAAAGDLAAAILDSAHALVVTLDIEGRITSFNRACELLTGYKADEVVGTYVWDRLLPEEVIEPVQQIFASLPEGGEIPEELENAWVARNGNRPIIAWNNSVVRNAAGNIELIVGIGVDITERRETADRLAMTADGLATAQRLAGIGSWRQTVATREEEWSDQFYRNLGLEPGSCPPSVEKFYEHVHPDDRQAVFETVRRSIEEKQPYSMDYRAVWPDGSVHAAHEENDIVFGDDGEVVALIGTMQDVTKSRQVADRLAMTADDLATAQRLARIGSWRQTVATREEEWSDQFYRNLGLEAGSCQSSSEKFFELVHPDDRQTVYETVWRSVEKKQPYSLDYRVVWPDGSVHAIHDENDFIFDEDGEVVALIGTMQDVTERRETADRLTMTANDLATAQRLTRIGSWRQTVATREEEWSDQFYRNLGLEPGSCPPSVEKFYKHVHPDDRQTVFETERRSVEEKQPHSFDFRVIWPDGSVRAVHEENDIVLGEDGEVVALIGTTQDVTESRGIAEELSSTADRLARAQRIAGIGNWEWAIETNEEYWSDQFFRNLGLEPGSVELSGDRFYEHVHPDDREMLQRTVQQALETKQPYSIDFRVIWPDGTERLAHEEAELILDGASKAIALTGTMQDVTELRETESRLQRLTTRLEYAQRTARIGNWEWDAATDRQWWSDECYRVVGYEPGEVEATDESIFAVIHRDDVAMVGAKSSAAEKAGEPYEITFRVNFRDGTERVVREVGYPAYDDNGKYIGQNGTIQDITEQHLAEQALSETAGRLGVAMRLARLGNWEWGPESNLLKMSDETLRICGLGPEHAEVDNAFLMAMIPEEEHARILDLMDHTVFHGEPYTNEYHIVRPDGDKRSVIEHGAAFRDEDTGKVKLIGTIQDITERKLAERNIALNLQRLDLSQEAAFIGSWEWNLDTGEVWWSDQQYRNYGAEPGSLKLSVKGFIQYLHPADQDAVKAGIERIVTDGAAFDQEYRVVGRDGVQRVLWGHGIAERDKKGKTIRLVGTTLDITVRKDAEWQLAIMAEHLKNAQRIANIGSWEWDILTNEEHWSDQNYRIYGLEPGSIQPNGDSFLDYVHPEDRAMLLAAQDTAIAGGQPLEIDYRSIGADGVERLIHASAEVERDSRGNAVRLAGTVQDITERKHIEQALQESEARLRGIFDHAPVGIGLSNLQAELIEVNQQFADFLGYSIDEMVGLTFRGLTRPDHINISGGQLDALLAGDVTEISHEKLYIRRDGTAIWGLRTLSLIHDEAGMPKYMVVIVKDIDDRKRAETDLARATERLEEAQRIANIGHWEWLPDSSNTIWSDEIYRIFGLERGAIHPTHDSFFEMAHEDDRETIAALMNETIESGEPYETEFRIIRADGAMRHIFERGERYIDEQTGEASIRGIMQDITERKSAEEKIRENTANLEESQRIAHLGSWVWYFQEDREWWSDEVYRIFGLEVGSGALTGKAYLEYVHPDDHEMIREVQKKVLGEDAPYTLEYRLLRTDGVERFISEYGEMEYDEKSQQPRIRGTIQDITERKQAEQALRDSEARLDTFFSGAPVGLAILDSDYRYVTVNDTIALMNGVPVDEHTGKHPSEILFPEKAKVLENLLRRTLEHGESIDGEESIVPDPDSEDRYRVYTQFPLSGDPKKPDTVGVVVVDITERVRAERALQQTMESLEEAQQIGQMGSWTWDQDNGAEWWSDQHYRIFGLEPESTVLDGFGFVKYVHPDDREQVEKIQREAMENRTPFSVEYRVIWPNGTERVVSEHGEYFEDDPTGKPQWRGVIQDITERKHIEQELARLNEELEQRVEERTAELRAAQGELIKSERLATLGQLTATVSHELRNPLGAMRTSMYVVEKKTDADDQRLKASIDRVNRNITRCDQIIDELLDYTRIRDLVTQQTNIDSWLGAVLAEQTVPDDITVKRKFGAAGAQAPADTDRLRRAFINIFENACQAAATPRVKDEPPRKPLVTVETRLLKDRLEILVSDNGPGIPAEIREKIFEPLFSTKNFGVGLGLPTVSQIMKQHGGGVSVREKRGGGAKFALWLPLAGELEIADT